MVAGEVLLREELPGEVLLLLPGEKPVPADELEQEAGATARRALLPNRQTHRSKSQQQQQQQRETNSLINWEQSS